MSISPTRRTINYSAQKKGFSVKPAEVNHFTGRVLPGASQSPTRSRPGDPQREKSSSPNKMAGPTVVESSELTVQVGDRTRVFQYEDEHNKPRLIDEYIEIFRKNEQKETDVGSRSAMLTRPRSLTTTAGAQQRTGSPMKTAFMSKETPRKDST